MDSEGTPFGRFTLLRKLAAGGMGEVFLAQVRGMAGFEKPVVLKRLLPQFASDRTFVDMFLDEARLAARLHHPNITQIFELGEVDGCLYLAMELVPGMSLDRLLDEAGARKVAPPLGASLRITLELLGALEYAHGLTDDGGRPLELVHRDVSPANVMLTPHGGLKLLDFGLATFKQQRHQSEAGVIKGKYGYMAPEQFKPGRVDARADLFATGAILYHLVTGSPAYQGSSAEVLQAMMTGAISAPRTRAPQLSSALESILQRALAPAPEQRYPTAASFREALERFASEERLVPSQGALSEWVQRASPPATPSHPRLEEAGDFDRRTAAVLSEPTALSARKPRRRAALAAASAIGLALCTGAAIAGWKFRPQSTAPTSAPPPTVAIIPPPPAPAPAPAPSPPAAAPHAERPHRSVRDAHHTATPNLEREVADLQALYGALRKSGGDDGLTGLEREAYRAALDAYATYKTGALGEAELQRALQDGSRILRAGALRRGLAVSESKP